VFQTLAPFVGSGLFIPKYCGIVGLPCKHSSVLRALVETGPTAIVGMDESGRRLAAVLERGGAKASPQRERSDLQRGAPAGPPFERKRLVRPAPKEALLSRVRLGAAIIHL
jgi:hypothetical protein